MKDIDLGCSAKLEALTPPCAFGAAAEPCSRRGGRRGHSCRSGGAVPCWFVSLGGNGSEAARTAAALPPEETSAAPPLSRRRRKAMRCCYSIDFGEKGKWRREAIPALLGEWTRSTDGHENVDKVRSNLNRYWFPDGADGGWQPTARTDFVLTALHRLLGIEVDPYNGALRYGVGYGGGGKKRKDPKSRDKVRSDAVLARTLVIQASPSFFFPKIREEDWSQKDIDYRPFAERGPIDVDAVEKFKNAAMEWAKNEFGDKIAGMALHLDEMSPHIHLTVIPVSKDKKRLASSRMFDGTVESKKMINRMRKYFEPIGLNRPTEGGKSTGETYRHWKKLMEEIEKLKKEAKELQENNENINKEYEEKRRKLIELIMKIELQDQKIKKMKKEMHEERRKKEEECNKILRELEEKLETEKRRIRKIVALATVNDNETDALAAFLDAIRNGNLPQDIDWREVLQSDEFKEIVSRNRTVPNLMPR